MASDTGESAPASTRACWRCGGGRGRCAGANCLRDRSGTAQPEAVRLKELVALAVDVLDRVVNFELVHELGAEHTDSLGELRHGGVRAERSQEFGARDQRVRLDGEQCL